MNGNRKRRKMQSPLYDKKQKILFDCCLIKKPSVSLKRNALTQRLGVCEVLLYP
jgi:hypothetical protein